MYFLLDELTNDLDIPTLEVLGGFSLIPSVALS